MKILVFAAHPDDDILGCGGMIAKRVKEGATVRVEFIAEGTSCRFDDPNDPLIEKQLKARTLSGIKSLESLGVDSYDFHNLPCGRLDQIPQIAINKIMETAIIDFEPEIVFTHSSTDTNMDHRIVNLCTLVAARPTTNKSIKKIYSYEILSSTEWRFDCVFRPNYFLSLDQSHLSAKIKAFSFYTSEVQEYPHPRSFLGIETLARYRGMQCGTDLAEAYSLIRDFEI